MFKRADLGKYLGIEEIRHNFKNFPPHYTQPRSDLEAGGRTLSLRKKKKPHNIFIDLDGFIDLVVRPNKPEAVTLVKWLSKKGI